MFPDDATLAAGRAYAPDGMFLGAICRICGTETAEDNLVRSRREPTGRTRTCRACHSAANAVKRGAILTAYKERTAQQIEADYDRLRAATGGLKRCTTCRTYKPKGGFVRNRSTPDGRCSECRTCVAAKQAARRGN